MTDMLLFTPFKLLFLLGLALFYGLAFEEYYTRDARGTPGGVRTFPMLALSGAALYALDPATALPFAVGLIALGAWLYAYYRALWHAVGESGRAHGLMVPVANVMAYLLGPLALTAPPWVTVTYAVAAVLLFGARDRLHQVAAKLPVAEVLTLGKFLLLAGVILPLLPKYPVTDLTPITPYEVWLALVAVSSLAYLSYLVQRYLPMRGGLAVAGALGGVYSSTATTVALARRGRISPQDAHAARLGIVLATAVTYPRLDIIIALFNPSLAWRLLPWLLVLGGAGAAYGAWLYLRMGRDLGVHDGSGASNPLELGTAMLFAALFVTVSLLAHWVGSVYGSQGVLGMAVAVGVTDINPFILSLAQGGVHLPQGVLMAAVLLAIASNNIMNGVYGLVLGGRQILGATAGLFLLAGLGFVTAFSLQGWS